MGAVGLVYEDAAMSSPGCLGATDARSQRTNRGFLPMWLNQSDPVHHTTTHRKRFALDLRVFALILEQISILNRGWLRYLRGWMQEAIPTDFHKYTCSTRMAKPNLLIESSLNPHAPATGDRRPRAARQPDGPERLRRQSGAASPAERTWE